MAVAALINKLKTQPDQVSFNEVMAVINDNYNYAPSQFSNGVSDDQVINQAGSNEGSCKIFAFGQLNQLSEQETLACFGQYYRDDVLKNPDGSDHANIRTFMRHGWQGISFDNKALTTKA